MSESSAAPREWLIDGHVHLHDCFPRERFFAAAAANFARARSRPPAGASPGVLMLTESAGTEAFGSLRDAREAPGGFRVRPTGEPGSLAILRDAECCLVLIAGRQVVTAEALEVLALGCDVAIADGRSLRETIDAVRRVGALPVVPWGFGKWWRARGALVADLLESEDSSDLFLGDNGGRLRVGRPPQLFEHAARRGFRVLPGSDPLPLVSHAARAGSYGFRLDVAIDERRPATGLKSALRDRAIRPHPFGTRSRLLPFVRNQLAMQWRKRRTKGAA